MHVLVILLQQLLGLLKAAQQTVQPEVAQSESPHPRRSSPPGPDLSQHGARFSTLAEGREAGFAHAGLGGYWQLSRLTRCRTLLSGEQRYSAHQRAAGRLAAASSPEMKLPDPSAPPAR